MCQLSQPERGHAIFKSIKLHFLLLSQILRQHRVRVVNDYADTVGVVNNHMDTRFFVNFREYLRKKEKFLKPLFSCSCGAQVEFF